MTIFLWGQRSVLGSGIHFAAFSDVIRRFTPLGNLVREADPFATDLQKIASESTNQDIHILFSSLSRPVQLRGKIIKWGVFEADLLSEEYINYLVKSDLIWVPSRWAKEVLLAHDIDAQKIDVVPEGVDSQTFNPFFRQAMSKDGVFRFFMCGKYEPRKGYDELLKGFKLAFGNDDRTKLYLKADDFFALAMRGDDGTALLKRRIEQLGLRNVTVLQGQFSASDLALINNYCDAQVFCSRAEGWGLPLIEGIACGAPTVSSFYSGQTEYLSAVEEYVSPLNFDIEPASNYLDLGRATHGASWAVANPDSVAERMAEIRDGAAEWSEKGLVASSIIRRQFSWERSVDKALHSLVRQELINLSVEISI